MPLYSLTIEKTMLIVYEIKADSAEEAKQKWLDGDVDFYEAVDVDCEEKFLDIEENS